MAHELAHVKNRDTLTMTITATLAGAISMLGNFAFFFGGNRDNNNPLGIIGVLVAMIVAPLAAAMVQMAISRTREYSADRRGAEICGQPLWLASALDKIAQQRRTHPQSGRRAQSGDGASLHHQPAVRRAHGQSVLDPSGDGEPHRRAAGDGAGRFRAGDRRPRRRSDQAGSGPWIARPAQPTRRPSRSAARPIRGAATRPDRKGRRLVSDGPQGVHRSRTRPASAAAGEYETRPCPASRRARRRQSCSPSSSTPETPLDGLTDNDNGHPHYLALDMRDRSLVRAILTTALRFRVTIGKLLGQPARTAAAAQCHGAVAYPACRRGADPVPRHSRQRRGRPRRHARQIRSAHGALCRPGQWRAALARARQGRRTPARCSRRHARRAGTGSPSG